MSRYLINFALLLAARNVQSILDFLTGLDAKLDAFIASRDAEVTVINQQIDALTDRRAGVTAAKAVAAKLKDGVADLRS